MVNVKQVHVAVGVVKNSGGDILLAKRLAHQHQGGLWEFPGGKVEQGETVFSALARELAEEVVIELHSAQPLMTIEHDYGDKQVLLDIWESDDFSGTAIGNEQQEVRWVPVSELNQYEFPKANQPIIDKLQK